MSIPFYIIITCWIAFILYWLISSFSVKRDVGGRWWGLWRSGWWMRVSISIVLVIFIRYLSPSCFNGYNLGLLYQHWSESTHVILAAIGAVLCILGTALAIWARVHLGRNWSSHPTLKENHELVTSGPYALIRHPIYTGIILATFGTGLVLWPWLIVFVIVSIMFVWRVHREEKLMMQVFPGEYPEYKKRTWALIPFVY